MKMVLTIPRHLRACRNWSLETCCLQQEVDNLVARDSDIVSDLMRYSTWAWLTYSQCATHFAWWTRQARCVGRHQGSDEVLLFRQIGYFLVLFRWFCLFVMLPLHLSGFWGGGLRVFAGFFFFNVSWDGFAISVLFFSWAQCLSWLLFQDVNAV